MFGSLFALFYYSLAFSTIITSFSTFHILGGRGQIFKEDFRGFERCPAGFWFDLVFALVFRFYNLVLNIIYLNSNFFWAKLECFISFTLVPAQRKVFKKMAVKTTANLLRICQTGQLIKKKVDIGLAKKFICILTQMNFLAIPISRI